MESILQITECWLACRFDRGMFSDERRVTYPAVRQDECQASGFVPSSFVRQQPELSRHARVKVVAPR